MSTAPPVRWAIVGTANIARAQFLPALAEAGGGRAVVVAGRERARAERWAADHGVDAGVEGYRTAIEDPEVEAVYVALPNALHAEWTMAALEAGKAVLCEKPLCLDATQTEDVLRVARAAPAPLWEAFVFPFQDQHARLLQLVGEGAIGEVSEVVGAFHFALRPGTDNIRLSGALGGGALADVGCYPVRLAQELLGPAPLPIVAAGVGTGNGEVDTDVSAVVDWGGPRLTLTCGFHRQPDTFARVLGTEGTIHLTNPYHPRPSDTLSLRRPGQPEQVETPTTDRQSFTAALRHIHAVVRGETAPRHLAVDSSLPAARTLDALVAAVGPNQIPPG